ncbi:hypothetical protein BDV96DRAFT_587636, partial [Lophiotrema nucula]
MDPRYWNTSLERHHRDSHLLHLYEYKVISKVSLSLLPLSDTRALQDSKWDSIRLSLNLKRF